MHINISKYSERKTLVGFIIFISIFYYALINTMNNNYFTLNVSYEKFLNSEKSSFHFNPFAGISPNTDEIKAKREDYNYLTLAQIDDMDRIIYQSRSINSTKLIPASKCSTPFVTTTMGGHLGNCICRFMGIYVFRIAFGVRVALSTHMSQRLHKSFQPLPLSTLRHPCFVANEDRLEEDFYKAYNAFARYFEKETYRIRADKFLNLTKIQHTNYITKPECHDQVMMKHRKVFQSVLTMRKDWFEKAKLSLEEELKVRKKNLSEVTLISVHVRRTDALVLLSKRQQSFPTIQYYKRALQFYRENCPNAIFAVVSDDLDWSITNLNDSDVIFPGNGNVTMPEIDHTILRLADHHIVGVGTFGKTSAYLGKGSAVLFDNNPKFYPTPNFQSFNCSTTDDIIYMTN